MHLVPGNRDKGRAGGLKANAVKRRKRGNAPNAAIAAPLPQGARTVPVATRCKQKPSVCGLLGLSHLREMSGIHFIHMVAEDIDVLAVVAGQKNDPAGRL